MLQLARGKAMNYLVRELGRRGYHWAYRVIDTRTFGIPQRRRRVVLLASRESDPRPVLFGQDEGPSEQGATDRAYGFYWTEGVKGLGWAVDAVPTIKGGSTIGIPSPPAIWLVEDGTIVTPEIRDAERLQGFESDWTLSAVTDAGCRQGHRWKLVGNAVSVPVAKWVGERLRASIEGYEGRLDPAIDQYSSWPSAGWGYGDCAFSSRASEWPLTIKMTPVLEFLQFPARELSLRATTGFLKRARRGRLRFDHRFIDAVEQHRSRMEQ